MAKQDDPQLYSSGHERNRLDRYWTNPWMTKELVEHVGQFIEGPIWEPAAGRGDMSRALREAAEMAVYSSDIDISEFDTAIGPSHERSFLEEDKPPTVMGQRVRSIITNPPYNEPWRGIADDFIRLGLEFIDKSGIEFMAMLLRSEFRSGKSRADMFGECNHYMGELILTTRPRWDYGDPNAPETAAPRHNFSWFLWNKNCRLDGTDRMQWPPIQIFSYMPKGFKP